MKRIFVAITVIVFLFIFIFTKSVYAQLPTQYRLYQNAPNPFDTTGTTIQFVLPASGVVEISVYDSTSINLVAVLDSSVRNAGTYSFLWNARNQSGRLITPGVYYCKMIVPGIFRDSIQMRFQYNVTSVEDGISGKASFTLFQNYPNPFNPTTTINYSIPKAGLVTLKVYNVLGKEVATLVNKVESSGNHHILFNANKLASGVYFYRLRAGNTVMTKKLLLMK